MSKDIEPYQENNAAQIKYPPRQRSALKRLFEKYGELNRFYRLLAPNLPFLLRTIYEYEAEELKKLDLSGKILFSPKSLPVKYREIWINSFLSVLQDYTGVVTYEGIIDKYDAFRNSLAAGKKSLPPRLKQAILQENTEFVTALVKLGEAGYDISLLGQIEAHWQIRRLTQVYFGRYSAEMPLAQPYQKQFGSNQPPQPELALYRRRQNMEEKLMGRLEHNPGSFTVDSAVYLAMYLDWLGFHMPMQDWFNSTRRLYEQKSLLMPGLPGADIVLRRANEDHASLKLARNAKEKQLRRARNSFYEKSYNSLEEKWAKLTGSQYMQIDPSLKRDVEEKRYQIRALEAEYALLCQSVSPSLCKMATDFGIAHVGMPEAKLSLSAMIDGVQEDAFSPHTIAHDYNPLLIEWAQEAETATAAAKIAKQEADAKRLARAQERAEAAAAKRAALEARVEQEERRRLDSLSPDARADYLIKQEKRAERKSRKKASQAEITVPVKPKSARTTLTKQNSADKKPRPVRARPTQFKEGAQHVVKPKLTAQEREQIRQKKEDQRIAALEKKAQDIAIRIKAGRKKEKDRAKRQRMAAEKRMAERAAKSGKTPPSPEPS